MPVHNEDQYRKIAIDTDRWPGDWESGYGEDLILKFGGVWLKLWAMVEHPTQEGDDEPPEEDVLYSLAVMATENCTYTSSSLEGVLDNVGPRMVDLYFNRSIPFPEGMPTWVKNSVIKTLRTRSDENRVYAVRLDEVATKLRLIALDQAAAALDLEEKAN